MAVGSCCFLLFLAPSAKFVSTRKRATHYYWWPCSFEVGPPWGLISIRMFLSSARPIVVAAAVVVLARSGA